MSEMKSLIKEMNERRTPESSLGRREVDHLFPHLPPCSHLQELDSKVLRKLEEVIDSQVVILRKQEEINEILVAWNHTKGFVKTMIIISGVLKWIVGTGLAISAIWYFLIKNR